MTFFLLLIFSFLTLWRPQEWLFPGLFGWPILDVVTALAVLSFVVEVNEGRLRFPKQLLHVYLLVGLWIASMMSHVAHTYFEGLQRTYTEVLKPVVFSILLIATFTRPWRLRAVAWVFVLLACLMAWHCLMQQKTGYGFAGLPLLNALNAKGEWIKRSLFFGIFNDPNDTAQFLGTAIPFGFCLFPRRRWYSFVVGGLVAWFLVEGVLSTGSRGGWLGMMATFGCLAFAFLPSRLYPLMMAGLIVGFLVMCPAMSGTLDKSAADRVAAWGQANYAFKQTPVFGVGLGMISDYLEESRAVHNAYILCYSETGLFGYWFWFGLVILGFSGVLSVTRLLQFPRNDDERSLRWFASMAIAAMASYMVSSYFIGRAYIFPTFMMFSVMAGIPYVMQHLRPDEDMALFPTQRKFIAVNTVSSIASVIYIYFSILLLNA